jgi:rRNA-processing protein FCF1
MSCSFLFFIERIKLAEEFFSTAEALVLTRTEFACLTSLSRKGFFDQASINRWIKAGKLREHKSKASPAKKGEDDVTSTVQAYRELNSKFLITEDGFLRRKLRQEGLNVISTPDIIGYLAKKKVITKERALEGIEALKVFGWHDRGVLDQIKEAIQRD